MPTKSRTTPADGAVTRAPDPDSLPVAQRARRARIVQAAIDLLAESEYESVQMRDVAEAADVALGTLYRYFTSKEHLYAAVLVEWSSDYRPRDTGRGNGSDSDEERLRSMMRRAVRGFERWPQMLRAQMVIENSADPNARALYDVFAAQNSQALASAFHHLDPATSKSVITAVNCVMANYLRAWAHGRCGIRDVDRAVQGTIDLIFGPSPE
jgi:AcrR family transcriptional regulator